MAAMLLRCGAGKTIDSLGGFEGLTALGRAVKRLNVPMVQLLLDAGADPEALDANDRTARDYLPPRENVDPQAWDAVLALLDR